MPHVIVKMFAGRSQEQKAAVADEITKALETALNSSADSVSVSIEDVAPDDWMETVYKPEILDKPDNLYKKPGYDPR